MVQEIRNLQFQFAGSRPRTEEHVLGGGYRRPSCRRPGGADAILRAPLLPRVTPDRSAVSIRSSSRRLAGFAI